MADDDFDFDGAEGGPERIALIRSALEASEESRHAVLKLIGRNQRLGKQPEILAAIRGLLKHDEAAPACSRSCAGRSFTTPKYWRLSSTAGRG